MCVNVYACVDACMFVTVVCFETKDRVLGLVTRDRALGMVTRDRVLGLVTRYRALG